MCAWLGGPDMIPVGLCIVNCSSTSTVYRAEAVRVEHLNCRHRLGERETWHWLVSIKCCTRLWSAASVQRSSLSNLSAAARRSASVIFSASSLATAAIEAGLPIGLTATRGTASPRPELGDLESDESVARGHGFASSLLPSSS